MRKPCLILIIFVLISCQKNKNEKTNIVNSEKIELTKTKVEENIILKDSITIAALNFINDYVHNCNKMKNQIGIIEWVNTNQYSSKNLKKELTKIIEEAYKIESDYGLGFDPIFNAQEYPDEGFKLVSFDTISGIVNVEDKISDSFKTEIRLIKEKDNWRVNGIGIINMPQKQ